MTREDVEVLKAKFVVSLEALLLDRRIRRLKHRVYGPIACTLYAFITLSFKLYYYINMDSIKAALKELRLDTTKSITLVVRVYNIDRSTLLRRFYRVTKSIEEGY